MIYIPVWHWNVWKCIVGESLRPHANKFDKTLFQFCYVDGTDCVQGMSRSFHLVAKSTLSESPVLMQSISASTSFRSDPTDNDENDFVEIEDEDGEIVIIKSRTASLEDELKKLESAAKVDLHCISFYIF